MGFLSAENRAGASTSASTPHTSVSVGTSSTQVAASQDDRIELFIQNDHASNTVYLSLGGTAEANKGIRLNAAGGGVVLSSYTGVVNGIATGAATTVLVSEVG